MVLHDKGKRHAILTMQRTMIFRCIRQMEQAASILHDLKCPFIINQNRYSIFDRTIRGFRVGPVMVKNIHIIKPHTM